MRLERVVFLGTLIAATQGSAFASEIPEAGLLGLMAPPHMTAGGEKHTLRLVALTAEGAPMTGLKVKVSPSSGSAGSVRMVEPGLYTFSYTTPDDGSDAIAMDVSGRTSDREDIGWRQTVRVDPKEKTSLSLAAEPQVSVLSPGASATLTVEGVPAGEALRLRTTAGTLKTQVPLGDGRVKVRYELPEVNYPHVVLMSASAGDASDPAYGALALPLSAKVEYPLQDSPGATLMLKVGDREFGPVEADQDGFAALPIEVPAGQESATLIRVVEGVREEQSLPLGLTEVPRVMLFPQPASIPGGQTHEVLVFAVEKSGQPASDASVLVLASAGDVGSVKSYGDGVYGAMWTAPAEGADQVTFSAVLEGVSAPADTLQLSVPVSASPIETLAIQGNDSGRALTATAELVGGSPVDLVAYGAVRKGATIDRGEGTYEATFALDSEQPGYVRALPMLEASTNLVEQILVYPMADRVAPDGISDVLVHAVAIDAFGFPVRDTSLNLSVAQGDGSVPAEVSTNAHGIATFSYRSGSEVGVVHVSATTAGVAGAASVLQVPSTATLPSLSSDRHPTWDGLMARAVYRSGETGGAEETPAEVVAAAPAPATEEVTYPLGQAGDTVVRLDLRSVPERPVPGDSFVLRIYGLSSAKDRVPGLSFDVLASAGEVTSLAEVDPGVYEAVIELPRRQADPVKVSVVGAGTMDFKSVEMGTRAPKEKKAKAEKTPRSPVAATSASLAQFRLSGAAALYSYEQQPSADSGPLLDQPLAVTGANRAIPIGGALEATGWMPGVEMLGLRARARMTRYGIAASIFEGQALDWLVDTSLDLMGRYTMPLPFGSVWAGGHVGARYDDFMIFTGCLEGDQCAVNYEPLTVPGLGLGVDVGVDLGQAVISAEYTHGFARFQVPYASSIEVRGGYRLDARWSIDVGLVSIARSITLEGADSGLERGNLDDSQLIMELGVGFRL